MFLMPNNSELTQRIQDHLSQIGKSMTDVTNRITIASDVPTEADAFDMIEEATQLIFAAVGEDENREGLAETPHRVAKSLYHELLSGYRQIAEDVLKTFDEPEADGLVVIKDIPLYSMCEHHMLPFHGKAHLAYIPSGKVIGLSKAKRLVDVFARRLQVQERLNQQIADAFYDIVNPLGVIIVIEAEHMCMAIRGVQAPGTVTTTSVIRGIFETDSDARAEALNFILK